MAAQLAKQAGASAKNVWNRTRQTSVLRVPRLLGCVGFEPSARMVEEYLHA